MKSKEELNALKEEVKTLNRKLAELTEEELAQVAGGVPPFGHNEKTDHTEFEEFSRWNPMLGLEIMD